MNSKQKKIENIKKKQGYYPSQQLGFNTLSDSLKPSGKVGYLAL